MQNNVNNSQKIGNLNKQADKIKTSNGNEAINRQNEQ